MDAGPFNKPMHISRENPSRSVLVTRCSRVGWVRAGHHVKNIILLLDILVKLDGERISFCLLII